MSKVIFQNKHGIVEDLGMRGDYPWSSKVGRRLTTADGHIVENWYATEINPSGATRCDREVESWINTLTNIPD
jgi:hypothetical protein